jgi:hypothetical protein
MKARSFEQVILLSTPIMGKTSRRVESLCILRFRPSMVRSETLSWTYKPQVTEQALDEDPAELIHEVLSFEREIVEGLEKFSKEVEA